MDGLWLTNGAGFLSEMGSRGGKIHQPENEGGATIFHQPENEGGGNYLRVLLDTYIIFHRLLYFHIFFTLLRGVASI